MSEENKNEETITNGEVATQEDKGQQEDQQLEATQEAEAEQAIAEAEAAAQETTQEVDLGEEDEDYEPVPVTLENLLKAGAHFGHKVERWNPKMLPYIYGKRGDIHIINLDQTMDFWNKTAPLVEKVAKHASRFLFVGTKDQAKDTLRNAAKRCGAYYIHNRWLGGTLTNFSTIQRSIRKMDKYEQLLKQADDPDSDVKLGKKEKLQISRMLEKLSANLEGIRKMRRLPDYMFVVDVTRDVIAVEEARKLHIPVIAIVDTNTDPSLVDYPIPANDDSRRTLDLIINAVADCVKKGKEDLNSMNNVPSEEKVVAHKEEQRVESAPVL